MFLNVFQVAEVHFASFHHAIPWAAPQCTARMRKASFPFGMRFAWNCDPAGVRYMSCFTYEPICKYGPCLHCSNQMMTHAPTLASNHWIGLTSVYIRSTVDRSLFDGKMMENKSSLVSWIVRQKFQILLIQEPRLWKLLLACFNGVRNFRQLLFWLLHPFLSNNDNLGA